ncbi:MAG: hypothetical protein KatS3mg087_0720 [Patescibacteria group bacterium]|nr:MAG: hypothetical protein KatS3mg087_0720 [Patescibacteria group bacterium]
MKNTGTRAWVTVDLPINTNMVMAIELSFEVLEIKEVSARLCRR